MATLKHHRQICNMDCGRSALITFTGTDMETVNRYIPPSVCDYGLYYGEILHAADIILKKWHYLSIKTRPVKLGVYLKRTKVIKPLLLLCRRVEIADPANQVHYIVVDNEENVYDPLESGVISTQELYTRKQANWEVLGIIY